MCLLTKGHGNYRNMMRHLLEHENITTLNLDQSILISGKLGEAFLRSRTQKAMEKKRGQLREPCEKNPCNKIKRKIIISGPIYHCYL